MASFARSCSISRSFSFNVAFSWATSACKSTSLLPAPCQTEYYQSSLQLRSKRCFITNDITTSNSSFGEYDFSVLREEVIRLSCHTEEVNQCQARLQLGWVTAGRRVNHSLYVTSHPGQLSLAIPPWVGAMSTSENLNVNRHTMQCTVSMVLQCKLASCWRLRK